MKRPDESILQYSLGSEITTWTVEELNAGEIYRFHIVAINKIGRSGNSPVLTTVAGINPGIDPFSAPAYSTALYRPNIIDVQETSMTVDWSPPAVDITGGTPITGYMLYMYEGIDANSKSIPEPVRQEIQDVLITGSTAVTGTFTASFRGHETGHIPVNASSFHFKHELENLPSINALNVNLIMNGWSITFLSEAGDLPLIEVTAGRLTGALDAKISVLERTKGDHATLIYDGSQDPSLRKFTLTNLIADARYAFKVAPVNAVGDGILSLASITTIARAGASPSQTTASGGALSRGIA
eukprot:9413241-Ditylum_brightwellii.AAC.1